MWWRLEVPHLGFRGHEQGIKMLQQVSSVYHMYGVGGNRPKRCEYSYRSATQTSQRLAFLPHFVEPHKKIGNMLGLMLCLIIALFYRLTKPPLTLPLVKMGKTRVGLGR